MRSEIGSEFHLTEPDRGAGVRDTFACADRTFVFSGRTAIETALRNAGPLRKAALPSYCCDSMIEPFRAAGIEVSFFPVTFRGGLSVEPDIPADADVLLWCNYFGFRTEMPDMTDFLSRGGIIIEDITNSFLSSRVHDPQSRFLVCSLRKWFPLLSGGLCADLERTMSVKPDVLPPQAYADRKRTAMRQKADYLSGSDSVGKEVFLDGFAKSNAWLRDNYSGLTIDAVSYAWLSQADGPKHRAARRANGEALYRLLEGNGAVRPLFPLSAMDCPLFVPVIVKKERRDAVRRRLTENGVYCPCHWPRPNAACESNLYDTELSLVCDQRYTPGDMERIVSFLA